MGALSYFDLPALAARYGLQHFIETGTGTGGSLAHASRLNSFKSLRSCEIEMALAENARTLFRIDRRITVEHSRSQPFLDRVCRAIPADEPVLFWLDAHFPGADYQIRGYGAVEEDETRLPLRDELVTIMRCRPDSADVLLVDDLRIWCDGPFGSGNLPPDVRPFCPRDRSADFFEEICGATHSVAFDWAMEGYVVITPKVLPA